MRSLQKPPRKSLEVGLAVSTHPHSGVYPDDVRRSFWKAQWMGLRIFMWWMMPSGDRSFLSVVLTTVFVMF